MILRALIILLFLAHATYAQTSSMGSSVTLPEIALIDIEPNNSTITLSIDAPTEAGLINTTKQLASAKWINYTSALPVGQTRSIYAQLSYGTVPSGTNLMISAGSASGGQGTYGSGAGSLNVNSSPKLFISAIGSCYTGNGSGNGHAVGYKLEVTNIANLDFNASTNVGIMFTLIDD